MSKPARHSTRHIELITLLIPALLGLLLLSAAPLKAQTEAVADTTTAAEPALALSDLSCRELKVAFFEEIPRYVYNDQSDALYELVIFLDGKCDLGEPLGRVKILASIWDGNFQEIIYGFEVISWLVERYEERRRPSAGTAEAIFDDFTTDFANQMLPHVPVGGPEEFFCLYYAGNTAAAWALLQSENMADTWLRYYYDEEVTILENTESPYLVGLHWGVWQPKSDQEFVGVKQMVGLTVEQRWSRWFGRAVIEGRLGRSDEPYFVNHEAFAGYSDRWNAFLLGIEGGVTAWQAGPHVVDVFVGLAYDGVRPFKSEEISLAGLNLNFGLGYRAYLTANQRWFVGADSRYEMVGNRNPDGTALGGRALSARVGLGFSIGTDPKPRLNALGSHR